jgi:hypothetical protein
MNLGITTRNWFKGDRPVVALLFAILQAREARLRQQREVLEDLVQEAIDCGRTASWGHLSTRIEQQAVRQNVHADQAGVTATSTQLLPMVGPYRDPDKRTKAPRPPDYGSAERGVIGLCIALEALDDMAWLTALCLISRIGAIVVANAES